LQAAITDVLAGGAPMTSEIARCVVQSFRATKPRSSLDVQLSAREEEVLMLLAKGYANKEIAGHLGIGLQTVGSHIKHIYEKLHVRSRAAAVARYISSKP
jgi:DNA-binding NarL/FixJ family response regulator